MAVQGNRGRHRFTTTLRAYLIAAAVFGITVVSSTVTQDPRIASAAPTPIMWGAWAGSAPLDPRTLDAFEQAAGRRPSIIHWGEPWQHGGERPFRAAEFEAVRSRGAVPMLDWGSWDYCCGTKQPDFKLAEIANGAHDAYLVRWAQAASAWGHPFMLRFNPEMNGWWLPWSEQVNDNQPGDFVRAWRHVVDIFRAQGATNATWVWCPNIVGPKSTPLAGLYPGDNYVDWTCMDGYNWGTDQGKTWQPFAEVFGGSAYNGNHNTYQEILDLAPNKPMMIGEIATSGDGGDPGAWVTDALMTQLPTRFPQIRALVWFNWNDNDATLDWPIDGNSSTRTAFAEAINSGYFASNDFGGLTAGAIGPIGGIVQPGAPSELVAEVQTAPQPPVVATNLTQLDDPELAATGG